MKNKAINKTIVIGALVVGYCLAFTNTASAQQDLLKAGGVDDEEVALAYYSTIDPNNERLTQDDWKAVNGFNDPLNKVVEVKGYFNNGDLGFWRSIEMVRDKRPGKKGNVAFTTVNYDTEEASIAGTPQGSIVNMEYSQGPDDDRITKFYVYASDTDPDYTAGERKTNTALAIGGDPLYLPAACFSCHGGDDDAESPITSYNDGSGESNATFLAFDVNTMTFNNTSLASLEADFKKLNKGVLRTDPSKATRKLIKGLYGGRGLPRSTQDSGYIPASWDDGGDNAYLYSEVIVPSCRLCHTAADTKLLSLAWWKANPDSIREEVFHEERMPNAPHSYGEFWASNQPDILRDALDRFESLNP
jgi:hypothetical protein